MKDKLVVVDFNPNVFRGLQERQVRVVHGDISNTQTLHHAGLEHVKIAVSTITDDILVGTSNLKLISEIKRVGPSCQDNRHGAQQYPSPELV